MTRDIDVVVVTYHSDQFIPRLAESFRHIRGLASIVFVDNAAPSALRDVVDSCEWPVPVTIIENPTNPGFGTAMNLGVSRGNAECVALVNPDVSLTEGQLETLVEALDGDDVGVAGARLMTSSGQPVSSARDFPTVTDILRRTVRDVDAKSSTVDVDWVCGALMVWNRRWYEKIGGFDDRYFLYYEDTDICRSLRTLGGKSVLVGDVAVIHDQGHGQETTPQLRAASRASRRKYARKWLGRTGAIAARIADFVDVAKAKLRKAVR